MSEARAGEYTANKQSRPLWSPCFLRVHSPTGIMPLLRQPQGVPVIHVGEWTAHNCTMLKKMLCCCTFPRLLGGPRVSLTHFPRMLGRRTPKQRKKPALRLITLLRNSQYRIIRLFCVGLSDERLRGSCIHKCINKHRRSYIRCKRAFVQAHQRNLSQHASALKIAVHG